MAPQFLLLGCILVITGCLFDFLYVVVGRGFEGVAGEEPSGAGCPEVVFCIHADWLWHTHGVGRACWLERFKARLVSPLQMLDIDEHVRFDLVLV